MIYKEIQYDLFEVNTTLIDEGEKPYCLAHCISADFGMFSGVVTGFNQHWNMKWILTTKYGNAFKKFDEVGGHAIAVDVSGYNKGFTIYNLITKRTVGDLPTYDSIREALEDMKTQMKERRQTKLAMPLIGCGIDGKDWNIVSQIIQEVFDATNVEVLVCRR